MAGQDRNSTDRYRILPTGTEFYRQLLFYSDKKLRFVPAHYYVPTSDSGSEPLCFVWVHPFPNPHTPVPPPPDPGPPTRPGPRRPRPALLAAAGRLHETTESVRLALYFTDLILPTETVIFRQGLNSTDRNRFLPTESMNSTDRGRILPTATEFYRQGLNSTDRTAEFYRQGPNSSDRD